MRGRVRAWVGVLLAGLAMRAFGAGLVVIDDAQQRLELPGVARRIVSLSPGATALLFAAGAGDRLVGTSAFSDEPAAAQRVPRIGDSASFDPERIVRLAPDVVIAWSGGTPLDRIERLRRLGLRVYLQRVDRLDDLPRTVLRLGELAGTQAEAAAAASAFAARIAVLRARYGTRTIGDIFIEVWDRPLYTVGREELLGDVVRTCGYRNLFADINAPGAVVGVESVVSRNPSTILVLPPDERALADWIGEWSRYPMLAAVRDRRVLGSVDQRLSRFGPGVIDATEALCQRLHEPRP